MTSDPFDSTLEKIKNIPSLLMLSGGVDSAVLLACLKNVKAKFCAVFLNYQGDKNCEQKSAERLANYYDVDLKIVNLNKIYENMSVKYPAKFEKLNDFYIPYRNGVFVSIAAAYAYYYGYGNVIWGLASSSSAYYSDCSVNFFKSQSRAIYYGTNSNVELVAPFLRISKLEILRLGEKLNIPVELTWSCAINGEVPCGRCFGCFERQSNLKSIEGETYEEY